MGMRATWDAAAASDRLDAYVGDPATAQAELEGLFGRFGDDPLGGVCLEVGCGPGRMTPFLAERFARIRSSILTFLVESEASHRQGRLCLQFKLRHYQEFEPTRNRQL